MSSEPIPERVHEVLVVRSNGCVMSQRLAHDAEASMSRAVPPAADITASQPE
jgi:hypothetical protein